MLDTVFTYLFNMSITAGYVILFVLMIRILLKRVPKKYSYMLWSVVAFRLAVPVSFKSVFSIFSLKPFDMSKAQVSNDAVLEYVPSVMDPEGNANITTGIPTANVVVGDTLSNASQQVGHNVVFGFMDVFSYIWLAGAVIIILYGLISYIVLKAKMSNAVRLRNNIYQSDRISSPFILGFIEPKIYIPFGLEGDTYDYVIAHEKCHIARCDYYIKAFAFILLAVHWYNPLCWLSYFLMTKDMEMSCDESVLSKNSDIRKAYSMAILSFAANGRLTKVTPLCFSENSVKSRIKNILKFKKPKFFISVLAVILCLSVIIGCAANPKVKKPDNITPPEGDTYYIGEVVASRYYSSFYIDPLCYERLIISRENLYIDFSDNYNYFYEDPYFISNSVSEKEVAFSEASSIFDFNGYSFSDDEVKHRYELISPLTERCYSSDDKQFYVYYHNSLPIAFGDFTNLYALRAENDEQTDLIAYDSVAAHLPIAEYKSYECAGNYFCYDTSNIVDLYGRKFYVRYTDEDDILNSPSELVYEFNGRRTNLINSAAAKTRYISIEGYIDDSLYFSLMGNLYRYTFAYAEDGEIFDSEIALVYSGEYPSVARAMKNQLIISDVGAYYSLNTLTGALRVTDYYVAVDKKMPVSLEQATQIAYNALQEKRHHKNLLFEVEDDFFKNYTLQDPDLSVPQLFYRPDVRYNDYVYETFPEYTWCMEFADGSVSTSKFYATVFVNAQTGEVSALSIKFFD